jgi:hypothetical protein
MARGYIEASDVLFGMTPIARDVVTDHAWSAA